MAESPVVPGLIVRAQSGFFEVMTDQGRIVTQLRGKLKRGPRTGDAAAVGDRVQLSRLEDGTGVIEQVEPRARVLSRQAPGRNAEQVIVANPDQVVFVIACADPDPNFRMLDRLLVAAEREQIPARICANKIDLVVERAARAEFEEYDRLGYPVHYVSALTGKGTKPLRKALAGKLSVFAGPSGVGKSSLLNAIQPGLGLHTAEVSQVTGKGTHTTVFPELLALEVGGYVADTPGLRAFALWDIEPEEVDGYFPELRARVAECAFNDCTHLHEPGCAVIAAVEQGQVSPERYDSYCHIRLGSPD
jgi:ribosome biogenesis GTPase / thiamine phosphate phosphatase